MPELRNKTRATSSKTKGRWSKKDTTSSATNRSSGRTKGSIRQSHVPRQIKGGGGRSPFARQSRSWWKRLFGFIISPVIRRLILIIVVICLLYLWGAVIWEGLLALFGLGLAIIAIALGVLIWLIWRGQFSIVREKWNWFLGGIALALGVWGILSFFSSDGDVLRRVTLGGSFGQRITGTTGFIGGLRVTGFVILGIIFIAPHKFWRAFRNSWHGLGKMFQPRPKAASLESRPELVSPDMGSAVSPEAGAALTETRAFTHPLAPSKETGSRDSEVARTVERREPILTPGGWQLPPINILDKAAETELDEDDIKERARLIEEALASYGVEAKVVQINMGPTVTQFGVEPGWDRKYKEIRERGKDGSYEIRSEEVSRVRIRVDRITSLANDLSLALAAPSIRIEAPVPGKSMVGIEVPNSIYGSVALRSVIETAVFQKIRARSKIALALGKGAGGEAMVADLAKMPHLLIAGATGSGKTVCLNSTVSCLLLHNSPDDVLFIMVDPKKVELVAFNGIPHLITPVIVDTDKAVKVLRWLNQEMDNRYLQFAQAGARNIEGYNKDCVPGEGLPYLVLVIDELADLMMAAFDEVEHTLCRLAQLARATGIHIIVATQRPSVDVVTGLIKANFPTRISFAVTSQVDSRTILDTVGAEKLLGRGDMLYMPTEASKPKRLQGTFVSDPEIERLVQFWANQRQRETSPINLDELDQPYGQKIASAPDPLMEEAKHLAQEHRHISTSFLQRRLHIGYPRAARIMEALEEAGLVETSQNKEEK